MGSASVLNPRFRTRAARTCAKVQSRPTLSQIPALVQCGMETETSDNIFLYEDIVVSIGTMRPYTVYDSRLESIDPKASLLPIRGTMVQYESGAISQIVGNTGKNCTRSEQPLAEGVCWKTSFGDWRCYMSDAKSPMGTGGQPPPPLR